jgi:hypothetical protein
LLMAPTGTGTKTKFQQAVAYATEEWI